MTLDWLEDAAWDGRIVGVDAIHVPAGSRRPNTHLPVVIFDGDDTLWSTEHLYDVARRAAGEIVAREGLPSDAWWHEQIRIDLANTERFGLDAERFPTSCVEAYEAVAARSGKPTTPEVRREVWDAGASVFSSIAPLKDDAEGVLQELRHRHRLVLLTQGDPRVQRKRITDSGLAFVFDEVIIVAKKSTAVLAAVIDALGIAHDHAWMVGNSIPSDVNPAVAVGMRAIWIDAHVWDHEKREDLHTPTGVVTAGSLSEVPVIISSVEITQA